MLFLSIPSPALDRLGFPGRPQVGRPGLNGQEYYLNRTNGPVRRQRTLPCSPENPFRAFRVRAYPAYQALGLGFFLNCSLYHQGIMKGEALRLKLFLDLDGI